MRAFCVCMQQFESRTLLSAGAIDSSYHPAHDQEVNWAPLGNRVAMQVDNKSIHYAQLGRDAAPMMWREKPDGSLDTTFGSGGSIPMTFGISDLAVQPDGKIVIATTDGTPGAANPLVLRYTVNGKLDRTFAGNGVASIKLKGGSYPGSIALAPGGKIVMEGHHLKDAYFVRLNPNGSLDTSFGKRGIATLKGGRKREYFVGDIAIRQSDNRLFAAGRFYQHAGGANWAVFSFNGRGKLQSTLPQPTDLSGQKKGGGSHVAIDADGSIVVGGEVQFPGSTDLHGVLARYSANGRKLLAWHDLGIGNDPAGIALQSDGKVVVADSRARRFNHDLTPDNTFIQAIPSSLDFWLASMAMGGDGSLILDGGEGFDTITGEGRFSSIRLSGDTPAATINAAALTVSGTAASDQIRIGNSAGIITVSINGATPFLFSSNKIKTLSVDAASGDDTITIAKSAPVAIFNGGGGQDILIGKRKRDRTTSIEHVS
jgi:uncharacterized delta-60 repeat protein